MRTAVLALLASAALGATPAGAAVQFTGSTAGCFGASCTPTTGTTNSGGASGLTYTSGTFNQLSGPNGFLPIGGAIDNFGTFNLGSLAKDYTGEIFKLVVNFTSPGTAMTMQTATLEGFVTSITEGGVFIDFTNSIQALTTTDGQTILFRVNDASVTAGSPTQYLSGTVQAVPEPGTWALMLLGFGAIGYSMRRRRPAHIPAMA